MFTIPEYPIFFRPAALLLTVSLFLGACAPAPNVAGVNDPNEVANRRVHKFNKAFDTAFVRPASEAYGAAMPEFVLNGVDNFSSNLALPGMVVNDALQLNIIDATLNTFRFVMNSTVGVGGLFDVATPNGLNKQSTDFGETLYVWGVHEGAYVELPVFGPSTGRDALGIVVDFVFDPVGYVVPAPEKYIGTGATVMRKFGDRHKYADLVDSVLYDSEDSYAQARLLYLQSRRRALQGELTEADLENPYAE